MYHTLALTYTSGVCNANDYVGHGFGCFLTTATCEITVKFDVEILGL